MKCRFFFFFFKLQVQEFSKRIKQDSLCRLQDIRLVMNLIQFLTSLFGNCSGQVQRLSVAVNKQSPAECRGGSREGKPKPSEILELQGLDFCF